MCNPTTPLSSSSSSSSSSTIEKTQNQLPPPPPSPPPLPSPLFVTLLPLVSNNKPSKNPYLPSPPPSPPPLPSPLFVTLLPLVSNNKPSKNPYLPSPSGTIKELRSLFTLSFPIAITALMFYSRSLMSTLFLGSLGDLPLAAGSLAIAFANITGYSVLSGLSLGMEPLCSQSFGANNPKLLSLTLHRSVLFLLCSSLPISFLWLHMSRFLLFLGQDPEITLLAQRYLLCSLPDLFSFSLIHPVRIYLRSQGVTRPLTVSAAVAASVHVPANYVFVTLLGLGVSGVAAAATFSNLFMLCFLVAYVCATGIHRPTWSGPTLECLKGWGPLVRLAVPSCVSVCLEWWWYELMILLCGLLPDAKASVASMGVLIQTTALLYVFPSSLGLGVSTRVGNELGAGEPKRARVAAAVAFGLSAVMGLLAMGFAAGMKDHWGRMFTGNEDILRLTAAALPIVGLCELGNCPQTVGCGVLRGSARPSDAANVNLGAFYLVGMPVAVGLGFGVGMGFCGLWLGLLAAQVCCAGLMFYVVGTTDWNSQARRAEVLTCVAKERRAEQEDDVVVKREELCNCKPLITIKVGDLEKIISRHAFEE